MAQSELRPVGLKCEYRVDPLGIDVRAPGLSWALESEGRGQVQSAYRILVAQSEEDLEAEENLLWDSGRVESARTVGVEYGGEALRSGSRCVWKVRAWNGAGEPSPYGGPAVFEMGLLERSDWAGAWISAGKGPDEDFDPPSGDEYDDLANGLAPSPYVRKEFSLDRSVRRARLYATARGVYELSINGMRVGEDVLAPGWTDYNRRLQYQTYDVTPLLAAGPNVLGAVLGDGWFAGFVGFDPKHRGALYGVRPHLLMGESYDARKEMPGWDEPGFDDSAWFGVEAEEIGDTRLVAQPDEGVRVTEEVEAKTVTEPESGVYVFDMGRNMVGWVRLRVEGEAGTEVTLRHAEALNPDGTIYTTNLRSARATDRYVLAGDGEEVYEPRFTFHGFRYVEVTGYPGEPPLGAVTGRVVHSATPPSGSFECSSRMVNELQQNILWGQRGNFLSVPTDCPQRDERLGWMGDAQVFVRTASFNMDVAAFFEKWMADVQDAQSPEGAFPDVAPLLR